MQQFAPSHYSLLIELRNIKSIEIDKFLDELPKEGFKQQESQSRNKNVSAISAATNTSHAPHLPQLQALVIKPDSRKSTDKGRFSSKITCRSNGYNGMAQSVQISSSVASGNLFGMFVCFEVYCCPNCQGKFNQNYFGKQSQYLQNSVFESALLQFYQNGSPNTSAAQSATQNNQIYVVLLFRKYSLLWFKREKRNLADSELSRNIQPRFKDINIF
ncbi:Hypothetical_protein [Hexamita inflata]|uniref:Hypothetical_protein n=1 Tax=Hexamita inflata TaxID=28002 RepID=A0AA86QEP3_9EUKA|nr:Hypothetical protein HINF_LOCUS43106 [Hexamita inflata]